MNVTVGLLLGAGVGLGVWCIVLGLRGAEPSTVAAPRRRFDISERVDRVRLRGGLAAGAAVSVWLLTGWVVGTLLAALAAAAAPTLVGAKARRAAAVARTEAIASWAEQLRDTIATAAGLQEAVTATARVAPPPIRAEVRRLARRARHETMGDALRAFAEDLGDPLADKVIVALLIATERQGRSLTVVLGEVAAGARDHATLALKAEAARAQSFTAAMTITGVLAVMVGAMLVFNRSYLEEFDTFAGQVVLGLVGALWVAAFMGLSRLARIDAPPRVLALDAPIHLSGGQR